MAYVGVLLTVILISFIVVRIGASVLQITSIEPSVTKFQALSAFTGTGFTTTERDMDILAIDRDDATLVKPDKGEKLMAGDRLLVYGSSKDVRRLLG